MNRFALHIVFILCFLGITTHAQDVHLTQFFTNPLLLSPASTGNFKGNIRGGANYKYQWAWATDRQTFNYHTQVAYADVSFLQDKVKHGWLGIGVNFLNDEAGDGLMRYMRFGGSVAWHQTLDRRKRYVLSLGFQANYVTKTADFEQYFYNNQWVEDEGFDRSLANYENIDRTRINDYDLGWGLAFNARPTDAVRVYTSFSMLHINRPQDQFYQFSGNNLGFRYVAAVGSDFDFFPSVTIKTDVYFTYQKKAFETVWGGMAGVKTGKNKGKEDYSVLWIGSYFRMIDAWAPVLGYSYKQFRLLVNYDVLFSRLSRPGKLNGGLEISIVAVAAWKNKKNDEKTACPVF